MKYKAFLKSGRISAKKARLTADLIRKKTANQAESILQFSKTKSAKLILKLLKSAKANAKNQDADVEKLKISEIKVDQAPPFKRRKIRSRGRADLIKRRNSHITIVLSDEDKSKKKLKGAKNGSKNKSQKSKTRSN